MSGGGEYLLDGEATVEMLYGFHRHFWAIAVVFFGAGDLITTGLGLISHHRIIEVGPLAQQFVQAGLWTLLPLKISVLGISALLWRFAPRPINIGVPMGLAALGVIVTIWNLSVIFTVWF